MNSLVSSVINLYRSGPSLPLEGDAVVVDRDQAPVGNGDAVGVAREIAQHFLGATERPFVL
jgi:hypothetical protein